MTLHQLRILAAVARHCSITKAAEELSMSQPAASHQLKLLEEEFETSFYVSSNLGVQLTREGEAFLRKTAPILAQVEDVEQSFKSTHRRKAERLIVGGNHTLSVTVLPESLMAFRQTHPWVTCQLETSDSATMERRILNGEVEIAVITHPSYSHQMTLEPFRRHEMIAFVPATSALHARNVAVMDIAQLPLVVRSGGTTVKELLRRGFKLNIAAQCEASEAVKAAVKGGLGVGLLNRDSIERELANGDLKEISVPSLREMVVQSFIIYDKRKPLSDVACDFRELLLGNRSRKVVAGKVARRGHKESGLPPSIKRI
ncbi:MAG TPA: LysR family transcriptional regulator [Usitatibacter sp.]|jgi:DNA-binding transcriptional LysR family regulator|nr:LysR family transcriptional regulator [Usitatibacter sp.]